MNKSYFMQVNMLCLSTAVFLISSLVHGKTEASFVDAIKSQFGTKSTYSNRLPIERSLPWINESIPFDLIPVSVDATFRHGTRYPSKKRADIWEDIIPKFQKYIAASKNNKFSDNVRNSVKSWKSRFSNKHFNVLTQTGWEEHLDLGQLYYSMMPEIWSRCIKNGTLSILSSRKVRSLASAKAFLTAIQHLTRSGKLNRNHPEVRFSEEKVSSEENKPDEENRLLFGQLAVKVEDSLLRFFDNCPKYTATVEKNENAAQEFENYFHTEAIVNLAKRILPEIDDAKHFYYVYQLCTSEMAVLNDSVWCHLFDLDDFPSFEYAVDLKHYYKTGHGYDINTEQACILLKHILERLSESREHSAVTLRFGHAETLIPLVCLLGFFKESDHLTADNAVKKVNREFKTGKISPFSGNLAIILYKSRNDHSIKFISFVLNERILKPFGLDCYFCEFHSGSAVYKEMNKKIIDCESKCIYSQGNEPDTKDEL